MSLYGWLVRCRINVPKWTEEDVQALATAMDGEAEYEDLGDGSKRILLTTTVSGQSIGGVTQRVTASVHKAMEEIAGHRPGARMISLLVESDDHEGSSLRADVLGVKEAAAALGVTTSRVRELRTDGVLPAAIGEIAASPLWDGPEFRQYAKTRPRKAGRPSKASSPSTE